MRRENAGLFTPNCTNTSIEPVSSFYIRHVDILFLVTWGGYMTIPAGLSASDCLAVINVIGTI
jgi:hypothetical protein